MIDLCNRCMQCCIQGMHSCLSSCRLVHDLQDKFEGLAYQKMRAANTARAVSRNGVPTTISRIDSVSAIGDG